MSNRTLGLVLVIGGVLLALVSLGADPAGLGRHPDFGWKQILGTVIGTVIAVAGLRDLRR